MGSGEQYAEIYHYIFMFLFVIRTIFCKFFLLFLFVYLVYTFILMAVAVLFERTGINNHKCNGSCCCFLCFLLTYSGF